MRQVLSGAVLSLILCGFWAAAQQPHVTQTLPSATVKLNGASGGGGSGTGFTYDAGEGAWIFTPPSGASDTRILSDGISLQDAAGTDIMAMDATLGATTYIAARLAAGAIETRDYASLSATGTITGANVQCETGGGAVVGTLDADAATIGRFVYVTRSGANTCTVAVESGHTLDGVTDGTTTVADGGSKTFKQTSSTAWITTTEWPSAGVSGLTATRIPVATSATALGNSLITHNSTTGVTSVAGTGPSLTITDDNLTTTSTDALVLQNTTAATAGVTAQYSPRLRFVGSGWKTTATAAAQQTEWYVENVPFSRAAAPANSLGFVPVRNGVVSSTPLWMCQMAETGAGTLQSAGLIFSGTYGRCDNSIGYAGLAAAGTNIIGAWNNATLTTVFATTGVGMGSGGTLFFTSGAMAINTTTGDTALVRQAAGILGVRGASSIRGAILGARVVAAQASTPLTLVDPTDIDKVMTNEGATASIVFNLPTAVAGLTYTFVVQDTDGLSVVAAAGDTIRIAASVSAAAGNIASTTIGNTVVLVAINATEWVAIAVNGTWTVT